MLALLAVALAMDSSADVGSGPPRQGTLVWSNATWGEYFEASARRLPNGDVIMAVPRDNGYYGSLTVVCVGHSDGRTRWETPIITAQLRGGQAPIWPVDFMVGPRFGGNADEDPLVLVFYGDGTRDSPESYMALDAGTGQVVMPGRQYPVQSGYGVEVQFADGVLALASVVLAGGDESLEYMYHLQLYALTIPDGRKIAVQNVTTSPAFRFCYAIKEESVCIAAGCGWFTDPMMPPGQQQTCEQTIWSPGVVAVATPASTLLSAGALAIVGSRPTTVGDVTLGSVIAVRLMDSSVAWKIEKTTASSIFVDVDAGIVVVGVVCPYPCTFRNLTSIRGHSLIDGKLLWERTSTMPPSPAAAAVPNFPQADIPGEPGWETGPVVGPRACEVVCGLPCNLIATSNLTGGGYWLPPSAYSASVLGAIDPRTGATVKAIPAVPAAYDTAGGVSYSVDGDMLSATLCIAPFNGTVVWTAPLTRGLDVATWQRIVAASPGPMAAAAVVVAGGTYCKSPTPRGCMSYESGAAAVRDATGTT